ncbi:putative phosphatase [Lyophyllum shimeji]|uniref:Phosphatase n=1 Tax=Lyophyllum shimeji TaxID=47721 RepID=A0A9P3PUS6_LYOSH|nr:putative phosphatase [Lyophyllum shimeji]
MPANRTLAKRLFGPGALEWADRSYAIDWGVVVAIWVLSQIVKHLPVYERSFELNDPLISHPHRADTVSSALNSTLALFLPVLVFAVTGFIRGSIMEIHHGAIAVCAARGLARLVTVSGKHALGRLRPDFLARCGWDENLKLCTGKPAIILSGRKSFPSGHSSTAFSGMTVLALWTAGMTAAWCFSVPTPPRSMRSSRMGRLFLTLIPLSWATFVAISRVQDYRHHKEDVIVGSLIGTVCATICYLIFWPNPFSPKTFTDGCPSIPRALYTDQSLDTRADVSFQLTRMEEDEREAV